MVTMNPTIPWMQEKMWMHEPKARDVIVLSLGVHEAAAALHAEAQAFQKGIQAYFQEKQALARLPLARLRTLQLSEEHRLAQEQEPHARIQTLLRVAMLCEMQDNLPAAILRLESALEISAELPDVYIRLSSLYERQKRYAAALTKYQERAARLQEKVARIAKPRPVLLLRKAPAGYRTLPSNYACFLCCGLSSSAAARRSYIEGFDEKVTPEDDNLMHLKAPESVIRLGFLEWMPVGPVKAAAYIGSISPTRHLRLMKKLSLYLRGRLGLDAPPQT